MTDTIDRAQIVPGATVLLRAEVLEGLDEDDDVLVEIWRSEIYVRLSAIVSVGPLAPKPLEVGDRARSLVTGRRGSIRAIDGDVALVRWDDCEANAIPVSLLERIP